MCDVRPVVTIDFEEREDYSDAASLTESIDE